MSKPFILCIVDDDKVYRFTVQRAIELQKLARKILIFEDGEQALQFMIDNVGNSTDLPDVIFLDINMPIMDGFQFMEEYVKLKPRIGKQITVYMVSSSTDPKDIDRAKSISEISDYLIKPIQPDQLNEIVAKLDLG